MNASPNSLHAREVAYLLHPSTNARRYEKNGPIVTERGNGIYVCDDQPKEHASTSICSVACASSHTIPWLAKFDPPGKGGLHRYNKGHENSLVVRAIQDSICSCPPMIITEPQIDKIIARCAASLEATTAWVADGRLAA